MTWVVIPKEYTNSINAAVGLAKKLDLTFWRSGLAETIAKDEAPATIKNASNEACFIIACFAWVGVILLEQLIEGKKDAQNN